jgi:hypothetical protein
VRDGFADHVWMFGPESCSQLSERDARKQLTHCGAKAQRFQEIDPRGIFGGNLAARL